MRLRVSPSADRRASLALARGTGLSARDAQALLQRGGVLAVELQAHDAEALAATLTGLGLTASAVDAAPARARCAHHPPLAAEDACERCGTQVCALCLPRCPDCEARARRSGRFKAVRVAVLLVVLVSTSPLEGPVLHAWERGLERLGDWFEAEGARWGIARQRPLEFHLAAPVVQASLPSPPEGSGSYLSVTREAIAFRRELTRIAASAARTESSDVHLVVALADVGAGSQLVEGAAEGGGNVGLVAGSAHDTDLALELIATAHEALHCLGAVDTYDAAGHALEPAGLPEPERSPRYPQAFAEVMTGEVADGPGAGHVPQGLSEVQVGPATAAAIGWSRR
jgi:hypothetical protein